MMNLITHCAFCGSRHQMPKPDFSWSFARSWCGDADSCSDGQERDDRLDLLCECTRYEFINDTKGNP